MKIYDIHQQHIYSGEIWQKTQCLDQEELANQKIFDLLKQLNFSATDHYRIWTKNNKRVIVCLVDDLISCNTDYHSDLPYIYDKDTTIITDNYTTCPTQYRTIKIPTSFFGIYSYKPESREWNPDRLFSFNVNRIDYRRTHLMLDLAWRISLDQGYVNFNCLKRVGGQGLVSELSENFVEIWQSMPEADQQKFKSAYERILPTMPLKNYDGEFDQVPFHSYVNMIVESYSSDNNISVSEKIFRALVTPVPWTVYSGRYTVAWLESLGFDCMQDIIDHNHYDRLKEVEDKIRIFNWKSLEIARQLKELNFDLVKDRCIQASQHNQTVLAEMNKKWPSDFSNWLDTLPSQLAQ